VSGGVRGEVFLHDLSKRSIAATQRGWVQGIRHLAIRPDGQQVAIVDGIGRLGLWNGGEGPALRLPGVEQQIQRVCFDASGQWLAAGDALGQVLVWDTTNGELLHRLKGEWSNDSLDRHPVIDLAFGPVGKTVHAACAPWWTLSWDLDRADLPVEREKRMALRWLKVLPKGSGVLTCGTGVGTISTGESKDLPRPATQHTAPLTCMNANGTGEWAATGSEDGSVMVWDVSSGATLARYDQHGGPVSHVTFSPLEGDDRMLSASADGTLALWLVNPTPLAKSRAPYNLSQRLRDRFDSWGLAAESK
jgi:WD40 repeat protein